MKSKTDNECVYAFIFAVLLCLFIFLFRAGVIEAGAGEPWELKAGMSWEANPVGVMVDHGNGVKCLHAVAAANYDPCPECRAFVDHGNYIGLRVGAYNYWVDKFASICRKGADVISVVKKTWVCSERCKAK